MKRRFLLAAFVIPFAIFSGCKKNNAAPAAGDGYKVYFKALRQNTQPAVGFKVDAWVKGKSEPKTKLTNADGMAEFDDLAFPDTAHPLVTVLHYFNGKKDDAREITYPFIASDAARLKDTQYIPNTATPDAS